MNRFHKRLYHMIHPYPLLFRVKSITCLTMERDRIKGCLKSARDAIKEGSFHKGHTLLIEARTIPGYERHREILSLLTLCGVKGKGKMRDENEQRVPLTTEAKSAYNNAGGA